MIETIKVIDRVTIEFTGVKPDISSCIANYMSDILKIMDKRVCRLG
ncbi:hypothetical protein [Clostridium sp.]|nr:hypothetical protein [Clostridium sp.]